jgi:protein-disulfide isomerase
MKKNIMLGLALMSAFAFNTQAAEPSKFTNLSAEEQEQIGKIASQYLLEHPEVLMDMSKALQNKDKEAQQEQLLQSAKIAIEKQDLILNNKDTPFIGPADAKIAIVEFFDYNCVYCSRVAPEVKAIMKNNPDIKFVFKEMPIFENSFPTSKLGAQVANKVFKEKGSEGYMKYHEAVYATNHYEGKLTVADIEKAAKSVGVDPKVGEDEFMDKVNDNMTLSNQLGIHGTPSFIFMPTSNQNADNVLVMMQAASKEQLQDIINQLRVKIGDNKTVPETPVKQ